MQVIVRILCVVREGQSKYWWKPTYSQRAQRCPLFVASFSQVLKDGQDLSTQKHNRGIPRQEKGINEACG